MKRMKELLCLLLCCLLLLPAVPAAAEEEVRGVWMASVYNLDFPTVKNNAAAQKEEFRQKLDALQEIGINTVLVQVRPKGDALYVSDINPWSDVLTGVQGKDPGYDPLDFMVREAHKRGMRLEAWLNPYRVTTSGTDMHVLADSHPAKKNPHWVLTHNNALFYNPALEEVKQHVCDTVEEIVRCYDVDGIHFDDYFYPSNYPLPAGEDKNGREANIRREHVNDLMERVYRTVKSVDRSVTFGISPIGIWKNSSSDPKGSKTSGAEGYYTLYSDAVAWIEGGYVDYIAPQLYWEMGRKDADYAELVAWWSNAVKGSGVKLYIGQGIYKDAVAVEIDKQLSFNTTYSVSGSLFYSCRDLLANRCLAADRLKTYWENRFVEKPVEKPEELPKEEVIPADAGITVLSQRPVKALANKAAFLADGKRVAVEAYNIDGYTYFKLRDVAASVRTSSRAFHVVWNEAARVITVKTGVSYTPAGGELTAGDGRTKDALRCEARIPVDGVTYGMTSYNIGGNNYVKLRDLAKALDYGVSWDEASSAIGLWSNLSYAE